MGWMVNKIVVEYAKVGGLGNWCSSTQVYMKTSLVVRERVWF